MVPSPQIKHRPLKSQAGLCGIPGPRPAARVVSSETLRPARTQLKAARSPPTHACTHNYLDVSGGLRNLKGPQNPRAWNTRLEGAVDVLLCQEPLGQSGEAYVPLSE